MVMLLLTCGDVGCLVYRFYCNQFEIAARCFALALEHRLKQLGEQHADTVLAQHNLGAALVMVGEGTEGAVLLEKAVRGFRSALGMAHVRYAVASRNSAKAGRHAGNMYVVGRVGEKSACVTIPHPVGMRGAAGPLLGGGAVCGDSLCWVNRHPSFAAFAAYRVLVFCRRPFCFAVTFLPNPWDCTCARTKTRC